MNEKLKALYQSVILKHSNKPVRFDKRESADHVLEAYNPLCGDRFRVFFDVADGAITSVSFHGYGCAISKASTSVLVKKLEGLPVEKALEQCAVYLSLVDPVGEGGETEDKELAAFTAARDFPGRLKCATLAWEEMKKYIEKFRN